MLKRGVAAARSRGVAAAAAWVLVLGSATFPTPFPGPFPGPDSQWLLGLDLANRAHLLSGTDIIWPYGPLGFLGEPMYFFRAQWVLTALFLLVVHFGLFACVAVLFRRWRTPWWCWLGGGFVLLVPQFFAGFADREGLLLTSLLFVVAVDSLNRRNWPAWLIASTLYAACSSLVVTTSLIVSGAVIGLYMLVALSRRRWQPAAAAPALFVLFLLVLWVAAGQNPTGIPAFLRTAYEIVSWYPATLPLMPSPTWLVVGAASVSLVLFAAATALLLREQRLGSVLLFALPTVVVIFRDAFVRFDLTRIHIYLCLLLMVGVVSVGAVASAVDGRARVIPQWQALGVAATATALTLLLTVVVQPVAPLSSAYSDVRGMLHMARLAIDPSAQRRAVDAAKQFFAAEIPLSGATVQLLRTGTVEPMPWDIAAVYAYDLRWNPQPVMESSEAFSAYLDTLDADHLAGTGRPDFVLLSTETIDGRYNPFDQPAVFRALLDRYVPAQPPDGNQLVLRPRVAPVLGPATAQGTTCAPLNQVVTVPSVPGSWVFANVMIDESALGRTLSTLFAPAPIEVTIQLSDGTSALYRLAPGTARDGLLVSGYATDARGLDDLFQGRPTPTITSLSLSSTAPADYASTICVNFWSQQRP
jgi:hypothetical protein